MINSNKISNFVAVLTFISTLLVSSLAWGQSINPGLGIFRNTDIVGHSDYPPITPVSSFVLETNVVVVSVKSIRPTKGSKQDKIYLSVLNDKGARIKKSRTHKMKAGDSWNPRFGVRLLKPGSISLLESDSFSFDDHIGKFKYDPSRKVGRYVETMKGDGGEYEVTIEVRAVKNPSKKDLAELAKIRQAEMAWQKKEAKIKENRLVQCIKKFSKKYPGTNVIRSWCKRPYFAVRRDRIYQCRTEKNLRGNLSESTLNYECASYLRIGG